MTPRLVDLTTAAVLLVTGSPDVPVLSLRVHGLGISPGDVVGPAASVCVHTADYRAAEALAAWWGLAEEEPAERTPSEDEWPGLVWRTWSGWVPSAAGVLPVFVSVTAAEEVPGDPVAGDDPGVRLVEGVRR